MKSIYEDKYLSISVDNNDITIVNRSSKPYVIHNAWPNVTLPLTDAEYSTEDGKFKILVRNNYIANTLEIPSKITLNLLRILNHEDSMLEIVTTSPSKTSIENLKKETPSSYLNIYFLMAVQPTFINFIKFLLCLSIQISISPLIIYDYITEQLVTLQDTNFNITYKVVASFVSLNIIFNFLKAFYSLTYPNNVIQKLHKNGLMLQEVNMFYYLLGYYVNILITIFSFLSATFLVFTATSPIRIILNGFAVTVVNSIDDQIITPTDITYVSKRIEKITEKSIRPIAWYCKPIPLLFVDWLSYLVVLGMLGITGFMLLVFSGM